MFLLDPIGLMRIINLGTRSGTNPFTTYFLTPKEGIEMSKNSSWPIWSVLGIVFAGVMGLAVLAAIKPDFMNAINETKQTEKNFNAALIVNTQVAASQVPVSIIVPFKTAAGADSSRDVVIYGYHVLPDGTKCSQFHYGTDNAKTTLRQVCVAPAKEVKYEEPWFSKFQRTKTYLFDRMKNYHYAK